MTGQVFVLLRETAGMSDVVAVRGTFEGAKEAAMTDAARLKWQRKVQRGEWTGADGHWQLRIDWLSGYLIRRYDVMD